MVMVLDAKAAVTPAGKPDGVPMPVANVVVCVRFGDSAVLMQRVCGVEAVTVILAVTVIVPVAFTLPQPPVKGIL